ncbi:MAG: putative capsular polysaccharide synthesis family protein [Bacillota bacterium]
MKRYGGRGGYYNVPVLSPEELKQKLHDENILVQISFGDPNWEDRNDDEVEKQLNSLKEGQRFFRLYEKYNVLTCVRLVEISKNIPGLFEYLKDMPYLEECAKKMNWKNNIFQYIVDHLSSEELLFICTIPKTGDVTFIKTFAKHNIPSYNTWHKPELIFVMDKKIKIISGIREPIGRSLSEVYHGVSRFQLPVDLYYNEFFEERGDAQKIFDKYVIGQLNVPAHHFSIPLFLQKFKENIIDLMKEPFDKERGYSIIKEGNIEVFVYTLEKLNDNVSALAEFVGGDFTELVMGNEASDKWVADSYKQAKKDLKLTKEYFESSYNEPFVKHFYTDADIEKFKNKWRKNVITEDDAIK